jgi:phosphoribosylaminoimidazolecarboxamide formyltransferase/IMP cyclohydrolase
MLDGRVKTLHPKVHAGILARRDVDAHSAALAAHAIPTIDLVVVNLYPFRETVAKDGVSLDEAIENIDIGGPTLVRAAAKNWQHVGVVVEPADYEALLAELAQHGKVPFRRDPLCARAESVLAYGVLRRRHLELAHRAGHRQPGATFPGRFNLQAVKVQDLRYGENPHQQAAFYRDERPVPGTIATYRQLQGKELSFNNLADSDAAWECAKSLASAEGSGVRHRQACESLRRCGCRYAARCLPERLRDRPGLGIRRHHRLQSADRCAHARGCLRAIPGSADRARIHADALSVIAQKKNVACWKCHCRKVAPSPQADLKRIGGGLLVQSADARSVAPSELKW